MVLPVLQALFGLLLALLVYSLHPIKRWRYRRFPGPRPWPLVGNLVTILREGQEAAVSRWAAQHGSPFLFWLGGVPVVMVDDPQMARKVLMLPRRHAIYSLHVGEQEAWDNANLVFINGEKWKVARNTWQPFFSKESTSRYGQLMAASADRLVAQLRTSAAAGQAVDVWRAALRMTLDVVGTTAFGVDFKVLEQGQGQGPGAGAGGSAVARRPLSGTHTERLVWALQVFFELFGLGNLYFALFFLFPELEGGIKWLANRLPNRAFKQELEARRELRRVGTELVQQAAADLAARGGGGGNQRPSVVDPGSFLALILRTVGRGASGLALDHAWASNQAATFILAGYETTGNAIAFAVYLIAANPEAEARLLAELDAWGCRGTPSLADLEGGALPYAQAVVREALRLYPPGSTAVREAGEGLSLGGHPVPALTAVQVSIYSMQRSPRYWRDPLAFKPERFLAGTPDAAEVNPEAYKPFGDGSRKCIGYRFALLEATLAVVKLYQSFTFRLLPGQVPLKVRTVLTLGPADGVQVTVHPRS